jgi:hypothetical protein
VNMTLPSHPVTRNVTINICICGSGCLSRPVNVYLLCVLRRDEVTGGLEEVHSEKLRDSYSLLNIVRTVKLWRM